MNYNQLMDVEADARKRRAHELNMMCMMPNYQAFHTTHSLVDYGDPIDCAKNVPGTGESQVLEIEARPVLRLK